MNIYILIANILTLLAFFVHTFMGDLELRVIEPKSSDKKYLSKQAKWTMARCGWHWISVDLLLASIGLGLINFTNQFQQEQLLLQILAFYFLAYGMIWLIGIAISKPFPKNYFKLGQWLLLWLISGLIYIGIA